MIEQMTKRRGWKTRIAWYHIRGEGVSEIRMKRAEWVKVLLDGCHLNHRRQMSSSGVIVDA